MQLRLLLVEPPADAQSAGARLDEQQAQLRDAVVLSDAEDAAGALAVDFGDPRSLALGIVRVDVVRDDARDERLERLVPAVFLRVERAVAADHPAEVTGRGCAEDDGRRPRRAAEDAANDVHRGDEPPLLLLDQTGEQGARLGHRPLVEQPERPPPPRCQRDDLAPRVVRRTLARHEAAVREPGEDPAEVAAVDVEPAAELADLHPLDLTELEQHPRLRERIRRPEQALAQDADLVRVEAVEGADGRDAIGHCRNDR